MSVYFIHAEVLDGGDVVTKVCATATTSNANEAFDWFLGCELVAKCHQVVSGDRIECYSFNQWMNPGVVREVE